MKKLAEYLHDADKNEIVSLEVMVKNLTFEHSLSVRSIYNTFSDFLEENVIYTYIRYDSRRVFSLWNQ